MKPHNLLTCILSILLLTSGPLIAQELAPATYYGRGIELTGTLGDNIKIEMHLQRDGDQPFWTLKDGECADVRGTYYYRSQIRPITLTGRICRDNQAMELSYPGGGSDWIERFFGKWNPTTGTYSGEWTMKQPYKTLPFKLTAVAPSVSQSEGEAFMHLLQQELATAPDEEWWDRQYKVERFEHVAGTSRAVNTLAMYFTHFSPTRLECNHNWSNAGTGDDQYETFQLLRGPGSLFVLHCHHSDWNTPDGETDEGELLFETGCGSKLTLWQLQGNVWVDVSDTHLPPIHKDALKATTNTTDCQAHLLQDALRIGKWKWNWVDGRFVER